MATILIFALTAMLGVLAIFQIALAAGAPLGKYAWGGEHITLPLNLRLGALSSPSIAAAPSLCCPGSSASG